MRGKARLMVVVGTFIGTQVAAAAAAQVPPPTPINAADWVSASDYPQDALAARIEGTVGFALAVAEDGSVGDCTIVQSSGTPSLDTRTCALLRERARFSPTSQGQPASRRFVSRIRWQLPSSPEVAAIELPETAQRMVGAADVYVGADGIVTRCETALKPYDNVLPPPSLCKAYPPGMRYSAPTLRKGKPVKRKVHIDLATSDTYLR